MDCSCLRCGKHQPNIAYSEEGTFNPYGSLCIDCYYHYGNHRVILYRDPTSNLLSVLPFTNAIPVRVTRFPVRKHPDPARDLSIPVFVPLTNSPEDQELLRQNEEQVRKSQTNQIETSHLGWMVEDAKANTAPCENGQGDFVDANGADRLQGGADPTPTSEARESFAPISSDIKVTSNAVSGMAIATDGNSANIANGCNTTEPNEVSFRNEDCASGPGTTNVNIAPVSEEVLAYGTEEDKGLVLRVNAELDGDLRRLRIEDGSSFDDFVAKIREVFEISGRFAVKYVDEEDESVTVVNEAGMEEMMYTGWENGFPIIRVRIEMEHAEQSE